MCTHLVDRVWACWGEQQALHSELPASVDQVLDVDAAQRRIHCRCAARLPPLAQPLRLSPGALPRKTWLLLLLRSLRGARGGGGVALAAAERPCRCSCLPSRPGHERVEVTGHATRADSRGPRAAGGCGERGLRQVFRVGNKWRAAARNTNVPRDHGRKSRGKYRDSGFNLGVVPPGHSYICCSALVMPCRCAGTCGPCSGRAARRQPCAVLAIE